MNNQIAYKDLERIQLDSHPYLEIQLMEGAHPDAETRFKLELASLVDDYTTRGVLTESDKDIIEKHVQQDMAFKQYRNPQCLVLGYALYRNASFRPVENDVPLSQVVKYKRLWSTILN